MDVNVFAEIIKAAAVSPLGIVALCCLLFAFLAIKFFPNTNQWIRLFVFILLFSGFIGSFFVSIYGVQPAMASKLTLSSAEDVALEPPQTVATHPESNEIKVDDELTLKQVDSEPSIAQTEVRRVDCGGHWSNWRDAGQGSNNPCPSGCYRGAELGQSYRVVGFPPRPQIKNKFQCWRDETVIIQQP